AVDADAGEPAEAGARHDDEAAARRPVRGVGPDADGAAPDRAEPGQEPHGAVPLADQVPRAGTQGRVKTPVATVPPSGSSPNPAITSTRRQGCPHTEP